MTANTIAILFWRFVGILIIIAPLSSFLHYLVFRGNDDMFVFTLLMMPLGAVLVFFSKKLGPLTSAGL